MRNRVEITGVNTSDLVTISNERIMELLPLSHQGDERAREELVYGNLKLVLSVIKKFSNRRENLDLSHGVRFSTYAVPMIIGEIRRYLRDNSAVRVSRSLKDTAYKALQFKENYIQEKQKEPTIEEIAEAIEVDSLDVIIALEAIQDPISIYTPIYNNGTDEIYLIDQIGDDNQSEDKKVLELTIRQGIKKLNDREKDIINKRYFLDKTQMEIAEEIGISQAQVSRLEKNALKIIFNTNE